MAKIKAKGAEICWLLVPGMGQALKTLDPTISYIESGWTPFFRPSLPSHIFQNPHTHNL